MSSTPKYKIGDWISFSDNKIGTILSINKKAPIFYMVHIDGYYDPIIVYETSIHRKVW